MKKRSLPTLAITVTVLLVAVTGLSVFAARAFFSDSKPQATETELTESEDVEQPDEQPEETDTVASATVEPSASEVDTVASATAVPSGGQETDVVASATVNPENGTQSTDLVAGATTGSATPGDDDDDDDEDYDEEDQDTPDTRDFISADKAADIALAQAGTDAVVRYIRLETEDYPPVYKIVAAKGEETLEITIHAVTGAILEMEREDGDDD